MYHRIVTQVYGHVVDAIASAATGKKHKVARLQLAAAYATAEFGLLAAVARQLQSYSFFKSSAGETRAIHTAGRVTAVAVGSTEPLAGLVDYFFGVTGHSGIVGGSVVAVGGAAFLFAMLFLFLCRHGARVYVVAVVSVSRR